MSAVAIIPNAALAPDGESWAALLRDSNVSGTDTAGLWQSFVAPSAGEYTLSLFVKKAHGDRAVCLTINDTQLFYNPSTDTTGRDLGDGWWQISLTEVAPSGVNTYSIRLVSGDFSPVLSGDGASGVLIFGADFKAGAPSTYIPTENAPATIVDYTSDNKGLVTLPEPLAQGAELLWTGWYEYHIRPREPRFFDATIMSQYANSPRLMTIIESLADAIDPSEFTEEFYTLVMNLPTAKGFGLDIWGRIVGLSRTVRYPNPAENHFGFEDGFYPFGQAPFFSGGSEAGAWDLQDDAYRELNLIKAISNAVYATAPNINRIIKQIFRGDGYYLAEGGMRGVYVFEYLLTPFEKFIFTETNILPRPCGVEIDFREVDISGVFGFYGSGLQPFNQGVFAS